MDSIFPSWLIQKVFFLNLIVYIPGLSCLPAFSRWSLNNRNFDLKFQSIMAIMQLKRFDRVGPKDTTAASHWWRDNLLGFFGRYGWSWRSDSLDWCYWSWLVATGVPFRPAGNAITKQFVELHGGAIWAESNGVNQGSTFSFVIPCNQSLDRNWKWLIFWYPLLSIRY